MKYTHTFFVAVIFPLFICATPSICSDDVEGVDQSVFPVVSEASSEPACKTMRSRLTGAGKVILANGGFAVFGAAVGTAINMLICKQLVNNLPLDNNLTGFQKHKLWCALSDIRPFLIWACSTMLSQSCGNYLLKNRSRDINSLDDAAKNSTNVSIGNVPKCLSYVDMFLQNGGSPVVVALIAHLFSRNVYDLHRSHAWFRSWGLGVGAILSQPLYNLCSYKVRKLYAAYRANLKDQKTKPEVPISAPSSV